MVFVKGKSGNPGGKSTSEAAALQRIKGLTFRAIDRMGKLMESDNEAVALNAAKDILDRGLGKAKQNVAVDVQHSLSDMHLAALRVLSDRARIAQAVTIEGDVIPTAKLAHD
jgi:carboxylesterase type B